MSTSTKTFTISTGISGADAICEVPPNPSSTLLLLVGWFGSKPKHVKKFQSLHRKMDGNTPTVSLTLPRSSVFGSFTTSSAAVQEEQLRVLNSLSSQILSPSTDNPFGTVTSVKWHVFSNGGCFLIRHLYSDEERLPSYPSIVKMKQITHSVIYDSAPCYPYMHLAARALTMGSGLSKTPNSLIENFLILPVVAVAFFLKAGVELLLGGKESPEGSKR
ncbi:hypothetical protein TL16_g08664 [Triparma laevis f. inornata]|uniref:Uncharacterized protein n=2 Tax=Triparma laevis TaxID=1534972 RepID=A0A9W7AQP3_9STRA|nr:hypothetical protein TrLO_g14532 [Triparma laevis f. longispina]GMH80709.1 hypothetical protein TL16_g08664 [Triparma laevis f. inornata]